MKNKVIKSFIIIILAILISASSVFAWINLTNKTSNMGFSAGYIDSIITVYEGLDNNRDGYLEIDSNGVDKFKILGNSVDGIVTGVDFNGGLIWNKNGKMTYSIFNFLPYEVYTLKIKIENNGSIDSKLNIFFDTELINEKGLDVVSLNSNESEKIYLLNSYAKNSENKLIQSVNIIKNVDIDFIVGKNQKEYIFNIEFESYENLIKKVEAGGAGSKMTYDEYRNFQNKIFKLNINVSLER